MPRTAVVTAVFGEQFHRISRAWFERNLPYFPADAEVHIVSTDGVRGIPRTAGRVNYSFAASSDLVDDSPLPMVMRRLRVAERLRLAKVIELCRKGYQCVLIDIDVALHKPIAPLFDAPQDLVFSRAFGTPRDCVQKIGFVACTGFWIASPAAVPFLSHWLADMETDHGVDQNVLNPRFMDLHWQSASFDIDGVVFDNSVASTEECSVAVLDRRLIERGIDRFEVTLGNHHRRVPMTYFSQLPMKSSPAARATAMLRSLARRVKLLMIKS